MSPSHANKGKKRYRYYITRPDQLDGTPAWRVSAHDLERLVCGELSRFLRDQHAIQNMLLANQGSVQQLSQAFKHGEDAAMTLSSAMAGEKQRMLKSLISKIQLHDDRITIEVETPALLQCLVPELDEQTDQEPVTLTCPTVKVRRGHEIKLIMPPAHDTSIPTNRDEKLVALVAEARAAASLILSNPQSSIIKLADEHNRCRTRLAKFAALSCLAPDIVTAIVEGRQPPSLDARTLLAAKLPIDWQGQRETLGFGQA